MEPKETSEKVIIIRDDEGDVIGELHGDLDEYAKILARFFAKRIPPTPPTKR